jgi:hypothetical protein
VGKTSTGGGTTEGTEIHSDGYTQIVRDSASTSPVLYLGKLTNDGEIVRLTKDGTTVGSIGNSGANLYIEGNTSGKSGLEFGGTAISPRDSGSLSDGVNDLGSSGNRFKDLYLSGGVKSSGGDNIFNDGGGDVDFRVESDTNTHALFVDAGTSRVGINDSSPQGHLSINGLGITFLSRAYTMSTTPVEVLSLDNQGNTPVFIRVYRTDVASPQGSELINLYIACVGSGLNVSSVTLVQDDKVQNGSIHNVTFTAAVVSNNVHISVTGDDNGGEAQTLYFEVHCIEGTASIL